MSHQLITPQRARIVTVACAIGLGVASLSIAAAPEALADLGDERLVASDAADADWFPDSRTLAYISRADGDIALVKQSITSTRSFRLGGAETYDAFNPRVSPNGRYVAYTQAHGVQPKNELRVLDLATGTITDFHTSTGLSETRSGDWSPDGTRLVFAGHTSTGNWRIYTAALNGSNLNSISSPDDLQPLEPTWSPTGDLIAFGDSETVKVVAPDGTDERVLTSGAMDPAFSPDGRRIALMRSDYPYRLELVNVADGSVSSRLPSAYSQQQADWSPSGQYLAFTRETRTGTQVWVRSLGADIPPIIRPAAPSVSIDAAATYTNTRNVVLTIQAPVGAASVTVANDGGFSPSRNFPVPTSGEPIRVGWTLPSSGTDRLPKTVYVRFDGQPPVLTDDIILDSTAPIVRSLRILRSAKAGTRAAQAPPAGRNMQARGRIMLVRAFDNRSGLRKLQIGKRPVARLARTLPYRSRVKAPIARTTYVRVQDGAGNWSSWRKARTP